MEDEHVCSESFEPGDGVAATGGVGVSVGGEHHVDGRSGRPPEIQFGDSAVERRLDHGDQVGLEAGQHCLGFRVAEPGIELDHFRTVLGEDQARIDEPLVRVSVGGHRAENGKDDGVPYLVDEPIRELDRRVAPHPAGVRSSVVIEQAFVVAGGLEGHRVVTVGDGEHAELRSGQELLDDDGGSGDPEGAFETPVHPVEGGGAVFGDEDPLSRCEAVGLHDVRAVVGVDVMFGGHLVVEHPCTRGGHPGPEHHVFGERLRRFEPSGGTGRPEGTDAEMFECVDQTGGERCLRANHHQVDSLDPGESGDGSDIGGGDSFDDGADLGEARVAGQRDQLVDAWRSRDRPSERVLATAAADEEYFHRWISWCRSGPTDTHPTGTPTTSSTCST